MLRGCLWGRVVFIESLCKSPVGFGWDTPICMGTAEPDPAAETVTALSGGQAQPHSHSKNSLEIGQ